MTVALLALGVQLPWTLGPSPLPSDRLLALGLVGDLDALAPFQPQKQGDLWSGNSRAGRTDLLLPFPTEALQLPSFIVHQFTRSTVSLPLLGALR